MMAEGRGRGRRGRGRGQPRGGKTRARLGEGEYEEAGGAGGGFRSKPYRRSSYAEEDGRDPLWDFGLSEAWELGTLSMNAAAERLNVSISVLKFRCRALGVARWPGRRLQGIVSCYEYVASLVSVR